jgi:hypothetical protein
VQKDGELNAYVYSPNDAKGPVPFVVIMHDCDGMVTSGKEWTQHVATCSTSKASARWCSTTTALATWIKAAVCLISTGVVAVLTTPTPLSIIWSRRKIANEVSVIGYSNGGLASLMSDDQDGTRPSESLRGRLSDCAELLQRHHKLWRLLRSNDRLCR